MAEDPSPQKIQLIFFRTSAGAEPVRQWLLLLCLDRGHLIALHSFIKKTRTTADEDLAFARKRHKELER